MHLSEHVLDKLRTIFQSCEFEKGCLLGCEDSPDLICSVYEVPALNAGKYHYLPDIEKANSQIRRWGKQGIRLCGFIHSHVVNKADFSEGDLLFAKQLAESFDIGYLWFGLVVVSVEIMTLRLDKIFINAHGQFEIDNVYRKRIL